MDLFQWAETRPPARQEPPRKEQAAVMVPEVVQKPVEANLRAPLTLSPVELLKPLWDHQEDARHLVHEKFSGKRGCRGLLVMATGAGKTVLFSALAADVVAAGGRVLILTDQVDLVDQALEKLLSVTGIYGDAEQGQRHASLEAKVVVGTVQTMRGRQFPRDWFDLVVCDECDRALVEQWQAVLKRFHHFANVLGVTATPNRSDRKPILRYFETKLFEVTLLDLIARKFLVPINVRELPLNIDLTGAETAAGEDYDAEKLGAAVEKIFDAVCDAIKEHAADRKILVFLPDRATSKKFAVACIRNNLSACHVDGESSDRQTIKRGFLDGRFQILCNPVLLGRGYDDPGINCVINLRPTKSEGFYCQLVGRGTRLYCPQGCGGPCQCDNRKTDLLVFDFLYQFKEMGPVRPSCLVTDNPAKQAAIQRAIADGQTSLFDANERAEVNLEEQLIKAMVAAQECEAHYRGEYFNAAQWAANLHLPDMAGYMPETDAESEPVTPAMFKRLAKLGFVPESIFCMGQAHRIIATAKARKEAGLCTFKQVFWLRKWGYVNAENFTSKRAQSISYKEFNQRGNIPH